MTLALALLLDALIGEPGWLWQRVPHPVVLAGRVIGWADRALNRGTARRAKGAALIALLSALAGMIGLGLAAIPGPAADIVVAGIILAHRSLVIHVTMVAVALDDNLADARSAVARIVGRDTDDMGEAEIARAAIESAAENFSDGVVAPAFWFVLAGLPGLLIYKLVNTADSMIGYRTERHAEFGWAAARLDDLLNWIPARLTALILMLAALKPRAWTIIRRDAPLHLSPNAGWPEAAMAVATDAALAGPRSYQGKPRDYPFVYPEGRRDIGAADIRAAIAVLWRGWAVLLACAVVAWLA